MELRKISKAELDKIIDNHKKWLASGGTDGERANLRSADLSSANLRYADLSYADLSSANLSSADLSYADLSSANLSSADLSYADLSSANLRSADLRSANLRYADWDFSAFPLWCGGLNVHIDDRQATQILYHLVENVQYSKNTSAKLKRICKIKSLVKQANEFHRVNECGEIVIEEKKS
jgi:uncharacterized protein YjbI with pentapeptide repeats